MTVVMLHKLPQIIGGLGDLIWVEKWSLMEVHEPVEWDLPDLAPQRT